MAMATALSTSLPHLPPHRLPSLPSAAVPLIARGLRRRGAPPPARLAASVSAASEVLDSTNGAVPAARSGTAGQYGREYFPLAAVVGQVRDFASILRFVLSVPDGRR